MGTYDNYGLLIDYKYCTNCHSCEVACQMEKDLPSDQFGIRVFESKPQRKADGAFDNAWDWTYLPMPTYLCDLCAERLDAGRKPMCVKHCLAACMEFGPMEELAAKARELGDRVVIFKPLGAKTIDIGTIGPEALSGDGYDPAAYRRIYASDSAAAQSAFETERREYREVLAPDQISTESFIALEMEDRVEFLNYELLQGKSEDEILRELGMDVKDLAHYECVFVNGEAKGIPRKNTI